MSRLLFALLFASLLVLPSRAEGEEVQMMDEDGKFVYPVEEEKPTAKRDTAAVPQQLPTKTRDFVGSVKLSTTELTELLNRLDTEDGAALETVIEQLVAVGEPATKRIRRGLDDVNRTKRKNAVRVLAAVEGRDAEIALGRLAVHEKDPEVRAMAIAALRHMGGRYACEEILSNVVDKGVAHFNQSAARSTAEAIVAIGDTRYVDALLPRAQQEMREVTVGQGWVEIEAASSELVQMDTRAMNEYFMTPFGPMQVASYLIELPTIRDTRFGQAAWVLATVTGESFGGDPVRWGRWWKQKREEFTYPGYREVETPRE